MCYTCQPPTELTMSHEVLQFNPYTYDNHNCSADPDIQSSVSYTLSNCNDISNLVPTDVNKISVISCNIDGFKSNFDEFVTRCGILSPPDRTINPTVYTFCETNISLDENTNMYHMPGYTGYHSRNTTGKIKGSGISMYLKEDVDFTPYQPFNINCRSFQSYGGTIKLSNGQSLNLICLYRYHIAELPADPDAIASLISGCDEPVQAVFRALLGRLSDLETRLAASEQYQRRSTLVISNLPVEPDESEESLTAAVCKQLSKAVDLKVTPDDIQAIHRNGKPDSVDSDGKPLPPPSITLRFLNFNRKDAVLRKVRNKKGPGHVAGYITPVPGGVGPMTVALLMRNTVTSAKRMNAELPADPDSIASLISGCDEPVQAVFRALLGRLSDLETRLAASEQYQRRSTLVISNLPVEPDETEESLTAAVCKQLSKAVDLKVTPDDIQAIHRNGKPDSVDSDGKPLPPPSITLRFLNFNRKDAVLRKVRNKKGPGHVRISQSLCPYYIDLRKRISLFCKSKNLPIRYIHYRSPSSGLVMKTLNAEDVSKQKFASKIFSFDDFLNKFDELSK
eukprot:sb/3463493/